MYRFFKFHCIKCLRSNASRRRDKTKRFASRQIETQSKAKIKKKGIQITINKLHSMSEQCYGLTWNFKFISKLENERDLFQIILWINGIDSKHIQTNEVKFFFFKNAFTLLFFLSFRSSCRCTGYVLYRSFTPFIIIIIIFFYLFIHLFVHRTISFRPLILD